MTQRQGTGPVVRPATRAEARHLATQLEQNGTGLKRSLGKLCEQAQRDHCLLVLERNGTPSAVARLDLGNHPKGTIARLPGCRGPAIDSLLLAALESRAARFGILDLFIEPATSQERPLMDFGYSPPKAPEQAAAPTLAKSLRRRQTDFARQVKSINDELGVPVQYGARHRLEFQPEANVLASIGPDVFDREQFLTPDAAGAWHEMASAAQRDNIEIQAVSAFRSVLYQRGLVQKKLDKGQSIEEILRVSAAPGFSEHHTGKAIDIATPGSPVLEEEFEQTAAYRWMKKNASLFGFNLSFPRGNRHGVIYEPWHWRRGL